MDSFGPGEQYGRVDSMELCAIPSAIVPSSGYLGSTVEFSVLKESDTPG